MKQPLVIHSSCCHPLRCHFSVLRSSITAFTSGWIINGISLWCKPKSSTGWLCKKLRGVAQLQDQGSVTILCLCGIFFIGLQRRERKQTGWCLSARREPTGWCTDLRWPPPPHTHTVIRLAPHTEFGFMSISAVFQQSKWCENKLHSTFLFPRVSNYLHLWCLITVACPVGGKGHGWLIFHTVWENVVLWFAPCICRIIDQSLVKDSCSPHTSHKVIKVFERHSSNLKYTIRSK